MAMTPANGSVLDDIDIVTGKKNHTPTFSRSKSLEPAASVLVGSVKFKNKKIGYGIPDDDTLFSHFPGYVNECSSGASVKERNLKGHQTDETRASGRQMRPHRGPLYKKIKLASDKTELDSKTGSNSSYCSCKCILYIMVVTLVVIGLTAYVHRWQQRQCNLSQEFNRKSLEKELKSYIFGQHIAFKLVPSMIDEYFSRLKTEVISDETAPI